MNKDAYFESDRTDMKAVELSVRGFDLGEKAPSFDKQGILQIPNVVTAQKYGIAVSSWKTCMESWTAAVTRRSDPDTERYTRLCRLLDTVIAQALENRYLILPELALPARWFIRIARKLQGQGILFVVGIELFACKQSACAQSSVDSPVTQWVGLSFADDLSARQTTPSSTRKTRIAKTCWTENEARKVVRQ